MTSRCRCWLPTWRPHLNFREVRGHHPRPPQRSDHWECLCWEVWVFSNSTLGKVVHSQMVLGYFAIETWDFPPCSFLEATGTENLHYKLFLGAMYKMKWYPEDGSNTDGHVESNTPVWELRVPENCILHIHPYPHLIHWWIIIFPLKIASLGVYIHF
jgi:hypothetical protein